ncbi:hypothetical protein Nepgr_032964 [Nepenthes gracilis]|uniref:DUF7792 domain-containing protein n=1 Tax=Nepenthes gracilis TaxID=150966 RepID=A0AAD3TL55_NEPGR|nr:hypothetical protein Nepgr_032964 [Nepenthes gracilis]
MEEKPIEEELSHPVLLSERVRKAAGEAAFFKSDCAEVEKQADRLSQMLRTAVRYATSNASIYERPVRRISAEVSKNLERALTLVRKCRRRSIFHRVVNIVSAADFRKIFALLDATIGDMRWLLSVFDCNDGGMGSGGGIFISLPPIASNDPILSWVWSFIASVQVGQLPDRVEAANELASLARDNDRNKKIIVEEGGVPPLMKLLKENLSPDSQMAAATALWNLVNDRERVKVIVDHLGVPLIVNVLNTAPMRVQIRMANLVARMAEYDLLAKEEFARENVIRPLVSLLSFETFDEDDQKFQLGKQSIDSIVQINKDLERNERKDSNHQRRKLYPSLSFYSELSSRGGRQRKERENESQDVKRALKVSCAEALLMLARDSVYNSRRIAETKGLLCLAKLIEKEQGELQRNCLVAVMEIAATAESDADFRRAAFKTNSPAAKAVVDQLLRLIKVSEDPSLQIPAIKAVGSLARTFPARELRVIGPLVSQLSNKDQAVATEAAIALQKFANPGNFLCNEHCKSIIEFNGIPPLMKLLRGSDRTQSNALSLLCYLAIHASNNEDLVLARVLTTLEGADHTSAAQKPESRS